MISPIQPSFNQPSFKSLDTKEKIVLSTPLLATVSAMNETGLSGKTSQMLTNGGRAFAKWTCGLLAAGTIISANKFLARNSKTVRDFEEKHAKPPDVDLKRFFTDRKTHLYTLGISF